MIRTLTILVCLLLLCGCAVISYDRPEPKLTWYWSKEAQAQRSDQKQLQVWKQQSTNQTVKAQQPPPLPQMVSSAIVSHRPPSGYTITNGNCTITVFTNTTPWQTNVLTCPPTGTMTLAWDYDTNHMGTPGTIYWIQSSTDTVNWSNYMPLDNHTTMLTVDTTKEPHTFYRIAQE